MTASEQPWIQWVEDGEATGDLKAIYDRIVEKSPFTGGVPAIMKCFSLRPDVLRLVYDISGTLQFSEGFLSRKDKEMIATFVSARNRCEY